VSTGSVIGAASQTTVLGTVRRGLQLSPEIRQGLGVTLAMAVVATAGRVAVPVTVQRTVDGNINAPEGPDLGAVALLVAVAAGAVLLTAVLSYRVNLRLFRATEAGLASLRTGAFRRVHDLSVLTQSTERRGALVSRVTSDVDTISTFVQFGGLLLILAMGQLVVATVLMAFYSAPLTLFVLAVFVPLILLGRWSQRYVSVAYATVRERVGDMLGAISETVVGADTIRAYAIEARTADRVDATVAAHRAAYIRAQTMVSLSFSSGVLASGLAVAGVVAVGTWLGVGGSVTLGELLAFLFLVQLFTGPVQSVTEVLNELQNAVAGWRRVLAVLDTPADVADPGDDGEELPRGEITVRFDRVSFSYPGGPEVLTDINLSIPPRTKVAVVGETGSGKTTLAKLLTRLQDPGSGRVLLDGVDLRRLRFSSLRERVVMVPQEGFLFDDTLGANIRYGRPSARWADVELARAYLADPDLLVLDEATSAVDPGTEVRIQRALVGVTHGRTAVSIAHRLSTAEAADMVVVVDAGRIVEVGHHRELAAAGGVYSRLHASWTAQQRA